MLIDLYFRSLLSFQNSSASYLPSCTLFRPYSYSWPTRTPLQSFRLISLFELHFQYIIVIIPKKNYCASQKILKKSYPFHYSYLSATQNYSYSASFLSLNQSFHKNIPQKSYPFHLQKNSSKILSIPFTQFYSLYSLYFLVIVLSSLPMTFRIFACLFIPSHPTQPAYHFSTRIISSKILKKFISIVFSIVPIPTNLSFFYSYYILKNPHILYSYSYIAAVMTQDKNHSCHNSPIVVSLYYIHMICVLTWSTNHSPHNAFHSVYAFATRLH